MNALPPDCPLTAASAGSEGAAEAGGCGLDEAGAAPVRVLSVAGDDPLSERLEAAGLWPGTVVERIARAPFGGPLLFRVQGYRLALLRTEAARVRVAPIPEVAG